MKKLIFGLIAVVMFNSFSFGQTLKGENKSSFFEVSIIKSDINCIVTEVKITNKETKVTLPSFIYKFTSDSQTNIKEDLARNPNEISGVYTIEVDKELLYSRKVENEVFQKADFFEFVGTSEIGKKYPCTVAGNFECAVDRINDMNWFDSSVCMLTAAACLLQTHISCAVDNCRK